MKISQPTDPEWVLLRQKAEPVTDMHEVRTVLKSMKAMLTKHQGSGLAAPQVGIPLRFFIMKIEGRVCCVINPEIYWRDQKHVIAINGCISGVATMTEGCLSFPDRTAEVERPTKIRARWVDQYDSLWDTPLYDREARVFQHEYDHLEGKCIFDSP